MLACRKYPYLCMTYVCMCILAYLYYVHIFIHTFMSKLVNVFKSTDNTQTWAHTVRTYVCMHVRTYVCVDVCVMFVFGSATEHK